MTRAERKFASAVNDTTSGSRNVEKAYRNASRAASVA